MQIVALAWLFAAAALAQDVPKDATPMDSLTIAQKKAAIDQEAEKADMAADTAMAEAEKEEAEEQSIEASVGQLVSDVAETGPQVSKQKQPEDEVQSKEQARARLKKAMEAKLKQENEAQHKVVVLKAAKLKAAMEHEKALQHKAELKAEKLKTEELKAEKLKALQHDKAVQLAKLEHEKMEVKRKLAKLEKEKSEEIAQLKQAEKLKKEQTKVAKEAIQHVAKQKMKKVEARIKQKASPEKGVEASKVDLDALVKKAANAHFKRTGKHFSKDAEARLKVAFDKKLHMAVAKRMKEKASVAPAVKTSVLVSVTDSDKDTSADSAEDTDDSEKTDTEATSSAKDTEDTEQDAEQGEDDSQKTDDSQHDVADDASNDETQSTDSSNQDASKAKSQNAEQKTAEADDAAASEQAEAEVATEQAASTEEEASTDGKDSTQDESADAAQDLAAQDSTPGSEADMVDETIEPGDEEATEPSDMDDNDVPEAEVFLQKGKASRSPLFFSTEDADLQPYLHPRIPAPRVLAARKSNRELHMHRRKRVTDDLNKASNALEQFKLNLNNEERNVAAPAPGPAASPGSSPAPAVKIDPHAMCEELCKFDTGMDGDFDMCNADCRVYVDAGGDVDSLKDFVSDETYNKKGGETMENHFEQKTGEEIPDCKPTLELDPNIPFNIVDFNGDGKLTRYEMNMWAEKACVPTYIANQIMDVADYDQNGEVTPAEYNSIGEDTDFENTIDKAADKTTKGEDQYEPVQLPAFRHVDFNSDGQLDRDEVLKNFKEEIRRRIPTLDEAGVNELAAEHKQELFGDLDKLDKNGDGLINEEEYTAVHSGGMGEELGEAAAVDNNNVPDPDDLKREYGASAPSPAGASAPPPAAASAFLAREA